MRLGMGMSLGDQLRAGTSTLLLDLIHYWPLNEISGTRYDSVGTNHFQDFNTTGTLLIDGGPSRVAYLASPTPASYLTLPNAVVPGTDTSFTVAFWIQQFASAGSNEVIHNVASTSGMWLRYDLSGIFSFETQSSRGNSIVTSTGVPNLWHFVVVGFDFSQGKTFISIDGANKTYGTAGFYDKQGTNVWKLGANINNSGNIGAYSTLAMWSGRVLDDSEIVSLYNSGVPRSYSSLTVEDKVDLIGYWPLNEESGARYDANGVNDLAVVGSPRTLTAGVNNGCAKPCLSNQEYLKTQSGINAFINTSGARWTVSFWSLIVGTGNSLTPLTISTATGSGWAFGYYTQGGVGNFRIYGTSAGAGATFFNQGFVHFFATYDNGAYECYANNVLRASGTSSGTIASGAYAHIGTGWTFGYYSSHAVDEVAIWNRVLTADERTTLYNSGAGKFYPIF